MKDYKEIFEKYIKNYNLENENIKRKYYHYIRVMNFCDIIAKSFNLEDIDISISNIIGLYHDIGRFEQLTIYNTYNDEDSIDHGDLGAYILQNEIVDYITNSNYIKSVIVNAVKNHNKYYIQDNLDEYQLLMTKIVRDADKLDIMLKQCNYVNNGDILNYDLLKYLTCHKMVENNLVKNSIDNIIRNISFIFDLNTHYSYSFVLDNNIINNKLYLIEKSTNVDLTEIKKDLFLYLKKH